MATRCVLECSGVDLAPGRAVRCSASSTRARVVVADAAARRPGDCLPTRPRRHDGSAGWKRGGDHRGDQADRPPCCLGDRSAAGRSRCRGRGQRVHPAGAVRVDRQPCWPGESDAGGRPIGEWVAGCTRRSPRRRTCARPPKRRGESSTSHFESMIVTRAARRFRPARSATPPGSASLEILARATRMGSSGSAVPRSSCRFLILFEGRSPRRRPPSFAGRRKRRDEFSRGEAGRPPYDRPRSSSRPLRIRGPDRTPARSRDRPFREARRAGQDPAASCSPVPTGCGSTPRHGSASVGRRTGITCPLARSVLRVSGRAGSAPLRGRRHRLHRVLGGRADSRLACSGGVLKIEGCAAEGCAFPAEAAAVDSVGVGTFSATSDKRGVSWSWLPAARECPALIARRSLSNSPEGSWPTSGSNGTTSTGNPGHHEPDSPPSDSTAVA